MAYLKAAIVMTLGVYFKVIYAVANFYWQARRADAVPLQ